ncbi:MAG: hypothetical protein A2Z45_02475 [Chloroflexi bacterium RBG_19FT_COMBO_55_16]|nr:MAG: hypothetical protein A2Z45_02475 [Chloroflexi bacterium RBG_19FT_COMBO_55_16]
MPTITDFIAPLARIALTRMSRGRLPQTEGSINCPGLNAPVEVFRDRWGVPHIYANDLHDLFFAQGFIHAQDRLWQMELNRRTAQGNLSELFGELALDTDRTARTFGFNRLARADWESVPNPGRDALIAYTEGVNAFLDQAGSKLPVEFTLIRHRPEPWHPLDSLAFMRVMIWQLSHAWYGELVRAWVQQAVGTENANELEIHYPDSNPDILPTGIQFNRLDLGGIAFESPGPFLHRGLGSNAWAVAGQKSVTGEPYLCNDMHLPLSLPGLWYQAHLVAGDYQVTGVTLPGAPAVMVGHNAHLAWGMTLAYTDCEDLFIEEFEPGNSTRYQSEAGWLEAELISEPIKVKGRSQPHIEQVVVTRHGPIISDIAGYAHKRLAVNSMALRPSQAINGWLALNMATGWDDFVAAMGLIEAPQLSVAYADIYGNIGCWITGKVPIRLKGDGRFPVPGSSGEYEWTAEVPFEKMPHALNPDQGYIVHTNNRIIPADYPYFLGDVWMNGYRARRITDVLESKARLSADDFRSLHLDYTCLPGKEFVSRLQEMNSADPDVQLALEHLRAWDGNLAPDSIGGTFYEVVRYTLVRNLLEPGLGAELSLRLMGLGLHPILLPSNEFYGHDTVTMLRLLDNPESWWIKQAGGREALLEKSLKQAVSWLRKNLGPDVANWQWGKIHRVNFSHPLSLQKPLDKVFNRGPFPIGGDPDTPCQTGMHPNDPYDNKSWSPSFRQIVDLGDLSRSLTIIPPGQSGQLGSLHYDDLIDPWLKGEYFPMLWTREQVEREAEKRLVLNNSTN